MCACIKVQIGSDGDSVMFEIGEEAGESKRKSCQAGFFRDEHGGVLL